MKRPLTLTGFILGTVFQGLLVIDALILFGVALDAMSYAGATSTILVIVLALTLALAVLSLIFNALAIPAWNKSPQGFRSKRGIIITAIVFNFIVVFLSIIGYATSNQAPAFLAILMILGIICANVLGIIDLARENKKATGYVEDDEEDGVPVDENDEEYEEVVAAKQLKKKESNTSSLEDKIIKLSQMKEKGLINEEEFNELKKKYISELL